MRGTTSTPGMASRIGLAARPDGRSPSTGGDGHVHSWPTGRHGERTGRGGATGDLRCRLPLGILTLSTIGRGRLL